MNTGSYNSLAREAIRTRLNVDRFDAKEDYSSPHAEARKGEQLFFPWRIQWEISGRRYDVLMEPSLYSYEFGSWPFTSAYWAYDFEEMEARVKRFIAASREQP